MIALRLRRCVAVTASLVVFGLASCSRLEPRPGEVCGGAEIGAASCSDPSHMLSCRAFTWQVDPCRGPNGCSPRGRTGVKCDRSLGEEGDPCDDHDSVTCASDHARLLRCDGSVMVSAEHCRGVRGCSWDEPGGAPVCDRGGVEVGDLCERNGTHCSGDGKAVLRCAASHRYVTERSCRGPKGCYPSPILGARYLLCDVSVGDVGEPCDTIPEGGAACSSDGQQENICRGGALAAALACPAGCLAHWGDDGRTYRIECRP